MTWALLLAAIVLFLCGALAGYKLGWCDAYAKGRADALRPLKPVGFRGSW